MCIIAIKPKGIALPDNDTILNMWTENNDGAGIMFSDGNTVHIAKGFMRLKNLRRYLQRLERDIDILDTTLIMHFRIATDGSICPANTHPFPLSASLPDLRSVRTSCDIGVAHNGIIPIKPRDKEISDTMEYIASQLVLIREISPDFYRHEAAIKLIERNTDSKWVFLLPDGGFYTAGNFIKDNGMWYSNYSYDSWWDEYQLYLKGDSKNGTKKSTRRATLYWLDPELEYLIDDDGEYHDADGYLIDPYGGIYRYDCMNNYAVPMDDMRIMQMTSLPIEREEALSEYIDIVD